MKVLVCCEGGNVRSVTVGFLLKYKYGIDTIAVGLGGNSKETINMLCEWADNIMVVEKEMKQRVHEKYHNKLLVLDIGPDRWGMSLHPELLPICEQLLAQAITIETK